MTKSADVIIAGLGAMGSAVLYQLARCGVKVLGLDRFSPPHDRGSSHGFKHSAAVGEALAEMTVDGRTQFDLSAFGLERFGTYQPG